MVREENEDREKRILDAASELIVHYGYDKTTVSDIAREAGVSKGSIYLHFKSKDELFEALLVRELKLHAEAWMELIEADPLGGTIGGMYKNSLVALSASPFMAAMFKRDTRVLGSYVRKPDNFFRAEQHKSTRHEFIKMMQEAGVVRKDIDARVTAHIMNMLGYGLVAMDEVMDREDIPPTEDIIHGIAEMMDRALTPEGGSDSELGKVILRKVFEAGRQQHEESVREKEMKKRSEVS